MADGSVLNGASAPAEIPQWMPPVIQCKIGSPHLWVEASVRSLRADPGIFVRDKELAHVTRTTEEDAEASEWTDSKGRIQRSVVPGSPQIHTMELETLAVRMGQWAHWTKPKPIKGGGFEDVPFDPQVLHARTVRGQKHWPGVRRLVGVCETPFPRPDMSIVQGEAHYDRATGYLYEPSAEFPVVKADATHAEAKAARELLEDAFCDFPFATDAGISGAVALAMTMIARPAIVGPVPAFVVGATTQGTGKSLLADVASAIAYGRGSGRMPFPDSTGRSGDEEIQKRLGMIARAGKAVVNFDNCDKQEIGGDSLELVISTPEDYTFRILGVTAGLTLPWRTVTIFTGNNPRWTFGMNRRILHLALESPLAQPEYRPLDTYRHPERAGRLFEYVMANRAKLVHAILTILRAYAHAGFPKPLRLGTFEAWAALIPSAIVWAGGVDPLLCRPGDDGEDSDATVQRQTIVREWSAYCTALSITSITAHDIIGRLYPTAQFGQPPPEPTPKWDSLRGAIETFAPSHGGRPPEPAKLALTLRGITNSAIRTHDAPAPLQAFHVEGRSGGRARWQVVDVDPKKKPRKAAKEPPAPTVAPSLPAPEAPPPIPYDDIATPYTPGAVLEDDEACMRLDDVTPHDVRDG